jgi:hypothetical protein
VGCMRELIDRRATAAWSQESCLASRARAWTLGFSLKDNRSIDCKTMTTQRIALQRTLHFA